MSKFRFIRSIWRGGEGLPVAPFSFHATAASSLLKFSLPCMCLVELLTSMHMSGHQQATPTGMCVGQSYATVARVHLEGPIFGFKLSIHWFPANRNVFIHAQCTLMENSWDYGNNLLQIVQSSGLVLVNRELLRLSGDARLWYLTITCVFFSRLRSIWSSTLAASLRARWEGSKRQLARWRDHEPRQQLYWL